MEKRKTSIDMLSRLPDEVLCHILSFLPTNLSVRTSVLAKRWRFLWAQVPNLIFYRSRLDNINRIIMLHESKIVDTFRLSYVKVCAYQLETLLIYPIRRGVRNLYLEFDYGFEEKIACTLSRFLFTCKTLVDLRLVSCGVIPSTGELFLPSLKKLNLTFVELADDESLPRLISGCPVLEDLTIHDCFRKEQKHSVCFTCISSPTIKTLKVDFSDGDDDMPDKTLIIDVPALVYLKLSCYDLEYVKSLTKTMASLSEAEITLDPNSHRCDIDCTEHGRSIEFLSCLSHVRHLKFSNDCGDPLFDIIGMGSMPKFVNLTTLKLDLAVDWYNVVKFLEVADNLQVLFINLYKIPPHKEPKRVPQCMLSRLRTVRMYSLSARQDGFDMVRYILMNAQVLERMEIYADYWSSDKEKLDALRRISLFERGSKSCQVAFN